MNFSPRVAIPGVNAANPNTDDIVTVVDQRGVQWCVWRDGVPPPANAFELHFARRPAGKAWKQHGVLVAQNNPHLPALAVAPDGTKVLVFEESANGVHRIGVLEFTAAQAATPRKLLPKPGAGSDFQPALAIDADGVRHILFSRAGTVQHALSLNGKQWDFEQVSAVSTQFYHPTLAADDNDLYAAWTQAGTNQVWAAALAADETHWTHAQVLGYGDQIQLAARNGLVVAAWSEGADHALAVRTLERGASAWGDVAYPTNGKAGQFHPHIAINSKGDIALSWMQYMGTGENYQIYFASRDANAWSKAQALPEQGNFGEGNFIVCGQDDVMHIVYLSHEVDGKRAWSADSQ